MGASSFESRNRRMAADASLAGLAAKVCRNSASARFWLAASEAFAKSTAAARNLAVKSPVAPAPTPRVPASKAAG